MSTKNFLVGLTLVLGVACVAAEPVPAASMAATNWSTTHDRVVVASTLGHAKDPGQLPSARATGSSTTAEDERSDEEPSNGRLMLIGALLIGVVALRGRKNQS